jgi:hypothetical protein
MVRCHVPRVANLDSVEAKNDAHGILGTSDDCPQSRAVD